VECYPENRKNYRLLKSEKELQSKISDTRISVAGMAFDEFKRRILQFCQNLMEMDRIHKATIRSAYPRTEDVTTMSSNATTVTVDKTEHDTLVSWKMLQRLKITAKYLPSFAVTTSGTIPILPTFWLTQMRYSITILPYERSHGEWSKELLRKYRIDRLPNLPHDFASGLSTVEQSQGCIFPLDHDYIPVVKHVIISIYVYYY